MGDHKPVTCCCGCSLICGIIVYVVFQYLSLVSTLIIANWWGAILEVIFLAPNVWVLCSQENLMARKVAYIFQWVVIIGLALGILIWAIAIATDFFGLGITETFCNSIVTGFSGQGYTMTNTSCENSIKGFMWGGLVAAALLVMPL